MSAAEISPASFRDPSGFIFSRDGSLFRQVNKSYAEDYDLLMESGLYAALVKLDMLIPHEEVGNELASEDNAYKILKPTQIDIISYPFEWCFSQLKDAALLTLKTQLVAMRFGMSLKDASAYNIQFQEGKAVFIDTLSFERYRDGAAWPCYKQFCQHFLAPLALMSRKDIRLNQLFRTYIDGPPLDLASNLLSWKSYLNFSLLTHIHLHAKSQSKYAADADGGKTVSNVKPISKRSLTALITSMQSTVKAITWRLPDTEWGDYYSATNYEAQSMQHKEQLLREFIGQANSESAIAQDLGANTGQFSRIAAEMGFKVIAQDIDPVAVEKNYLAGKQNKEKNILPLLLDLTNPSPAIGWNLEERMSFLERSENNLVLALALVHHLAISNNVPLDLIAKFFSQCAESLIIEFVPKQDSQVKRLLASREDIFPDYHEAGFEQAFAKYFTLSTQQAINSCERTLYLFKRKTT